MLIALQTICKSTAHWMVLGRLENKVKVLPHNGPADRDLWQTAEVAVTHAYIHAPCVG